MNRDEPTLKTFMSSINPEWSIEDWLSWPPDLFLLTSVIFKSTGAYRYVVSPPRGLWPDTHDWHGFVASSAIAWRNWLVKPAEGLPKFLIKAQAIIARDWDNVLINSIGSIERIDSEESSKGAWLLCRTLLELHAAADEACRGFGLPSGSYARLNPSMRSEMSSIDYLANMLLAVTGSLSRLPRSHGVILPKMRTPQIGLTLRSISHHLTYHQSEVQVIWRTMPWVNIDENTINILVVPWPTEMKPKWFQPEHHFVRRESSEPARYFAYSRGANAIDIEKIMTLVSAAESSANRIHMIVFPELALTDKELTDLKNILAAKLTRDRIPMIIAGLCEGPREAPEALGYNKVVLSTFFAGKWYDLHQNKHHRWKLDGHQIQQYNLGGVLAGSKDWWEAIEIPERKLTFMAPNGWLTLCPLICEDLARLEPISDLIRGVGPTLLIAILLDGPQLRERWPGRYASVLADDPGTSVLTVSSLGMAKCSTPQTREKSSGNIALWKDQIRGWKDIKVEEDEDSILITLAASWLEEFTADGRGDDKAAAVFVLQGTTGLTSQVATEASNFPDKEGPKSYESGIASDVHEMTVFAYFVEAVLDSTTHMVENLRSWALGERCGPEFDWLKDSLKPKDSIWQIIVQNYPKLSSEFRALVGWFTDLLVLVPTPNCRDLSDYWSKLVNEAATVLNNVNQDSWQKNIRINDTLDREMKKGLPVHESIRVQVYSALSLLWAVHRRLSRERREVGMTQVTANLMNHVESLLPGEYDKKWYKAKELYMSELSK